MLCMGLSHRCTAIHFVWCLLGAAVQATGEATPVGTLHGCIHIFHCIGVVMQLWARFQEARKAGKKTYFNRARLFVENKEVKP